MPRSAEDTASDAAEEAARDMGDYIDELVAAVPDADAPSAAPAEGPDADLINATRGEDFSFEGQRFVAKVVDVYDGDTVRVRFYDRPRPAGQLVQYRARMAGYDSPEMRPPKASPSRQAEIKAAHAARDALAGRLAEIRPHPWVVEIECGAFDKYGRLLVTVYAAGENLNEWMVQNGHGVPYDGGTKAQFAAE